LKKNGASHPAVEAGRDVARAAAAPGQNLDTSACLAVQPSQSLIECLRQGCGSLLHVRQPQLRRVTLQSQDEGSSRALAEALRPGHQVIRPAERVEHQTQKTLQAGEPLQGVDFAGREAASFDQGGGPVEALEDRDVGSGIVDTQLL